MVIEYISENLSQNLITELMEKTDAMITTNAACLCISV